MKNKTETNPAPADIDGTASSEKTKNNKVDRATPAIVYQAINIDSLFCDITYPKKRLIKVC